MLQQTRQLTDGKTYLAFFDHPRKYGNGRDIFIEISCPDAETAKKARIILEMQVGIFCQPPNSTQQSLLVDYGIK